MKFDPTLIKNGFLSVPFHANMDIVPAFRYNTENFTFDDLEDKVVVGLLLSVTTPDNKFMHMGSLSIKSRNIARDGKRPRLVTPHAVIYTFADLLALPHCFCIVYRNKRDFQMNMGPSKHSDFVCIGDILAWVEPTPTENTLGENITILHKPRCGTVLRNTMAWPTLPPSQNNTPGHQNAFLCYNKQINVSSSILTSRDMNCKRYACDAQTAHCKGCHGTSPFVGKLILDQHVEIQDCPQYGTGGTALFLNFRSNRTTVIFFEEWGKFTMLPEEVIERINVTIRAQIRVLVNIINRNGGWTIAGWHRRGIIEDEDTGELQISTKTKGHLTLLIPSNPAVLETNEYKDNIIKLPSLEIPAQDNNNNNNNNPGNNNNNNNNQGNNNNNNPGNNNKNNNNINNNPANNNNNNNNNNNPANNNNNNNNPSSNNNPANNNNSVSNNNNPGNNNNNNNPRNNNYTSSIDIP